MPSTKGEIISAARERIIGSLAANWAMRGVSRGLVEKSVYLALGWRMNSLARSIGV